MCIVHRLDLESQERFACAQAGCAECVEALLRRHERLVHSVLRRQWWGAVRCADLLQEGRIGLWQAIMHFDPQRGIAFSTYAWPAITRRMWRAVQVDRRQRGLQDGEVRTRSICVWSTLPNPLSIAEEALWWEQVCATLSEMVAHLPERLQKVVVVYYGLDGGPPCTLAAIGRWYEVSGEMVRVWRNEALIQLRMPVFSARLRQLCGQDTRQAYRRAQALNGSWLGRRRKGKVR
jgi:RNA polymerase sigma factor (sigma-70 family)